MRFVHTLAALVAALALLACATPAPSGDAFFHALRTYRTALGVVTAGCLEEPRTLTDDQCRRAAEADMDVQRALVAAQVLLADPEADPADVEAALAILEQALIRFLVFESLEEN